MFIDQDGTLYVGDLRSGDREATTEEVAAWEESRKPTPQEQIRALEAQNADAQAKITRQALLMQTVALALASPAGIALTVGMTPEDAKAAVGARLLETDSNFKLMYELEQQVAVWRAQL